MPSNRRIKTTALIALLTVLIVLYITHGRSSTETSPFYTRTVAAITERQNAEAREAVVADERQRMERVKKVEEEHKAAVAAAEKEDPGPAVGGDAGRAAGKGVGKEGQKPLVEDVKDAVTGEQSSGEKSVTGRKTMKDKDGKYVINEKASGDDGVAKVGNIGPKASKAVAESGKSDGEEETEMEHRVEEEMNSILKKGAVIVFSKSYCPYSKKAKHILLDLYTITPPPYVVELDQHELGSGLQAALLKSTGRRTVPNVLINGKSIGGGDDIAALHASGKLAETVAEMGGKRVMSVEPKEPEEEVPKVHEVREVRFRA